MGIFSDAVHGIGTAASDVGGIFQNAANDAINFATQGVPAIADLAASNAAAPFAAGYGVTGLPGSSGAMHFAEAVPQADLNAVKGIGSYYGSKYGPIFADAARGLLDLGMGNVGGAAGDFGGAQVQFAKDFYSHPLYTGLDVAGLVSGGEGALADLGSIAPRLASRGAFADAAAAGADSASATDAALAAHAASIAGQPDWLQAFTDPARRVRPGKVFTADTTGRQVVKGVKRYSAKPLTRTFQKQLDAATNWVQDAIPAETPHLGSFARAGRVEAKTARTMAQTAKAAGYLGAKEAGSHALAGVLNKMGRIPGLRGLSNNMVEHSAVFWLAHGVTMDEVVRFYQGVVADLKDAGKDPNAAEHNLHLAERAPSAYNSLESSPPHIQEAVARFRTLMDNTRQTAQNTLGLTPDQMANREHLAQNVMRFGSHWNPNLVKQTPELLKATADHWAAIKRLTAAENGTDVVEASRARSAADEALAKYQLAREHAKGGLTAPTIPAGESYRPGVYVPHRPMVGPVGGPGGDFTGNAGFGAPGFHETHGQLLASGNIRPDPSLAIAYSEGIFTRASMLKGLFGDDTRANPGIVDGWIVHDPNTGERLTGPLAVVKWQSDPQNLAVINMRTISDALSRAQELSLSGAREIGVPLDPVVPDAEVLQLAAKDWPGRPTDYVVVARPAADAWREIVQTGRLSGPLAAYDKMLGWWKVGVLGLRPAFQVHVTLSHMSQYAILAAGDFRSIFQVGKDGSDLRTAIAAHEPTSAMGFQPAERISLFKLHTPGPGVKDAGWVVRVGQQMVRIPRASFRLNDAMQNRIRAAGYLAAAKQVGRDIGLPVSKMSPEDVIAYLARDPAASAEVLREFSNFLGDYIHYTPFEQQWLRRIFPFYSWLRVATRLSFSLPVGHPLRAEALAIAARGAQVAIDPQNVQGQLPIYDRGYMPILGTHAAIGMSTANPFSDVARMLGGLEQGGPSGLAQALYAGSASPFVQFGASAITGTDPLTGQPYYAPPGFGDTVTSQYGATMKIDPTTGLPTYTSAPAPGLGQQIASQIPLESTLRGLLSGSGHPYPTTSDLSLLESALGIGSPPPQDAFTPPSQTPGVLGSVPYLTTGSSFLGLPYKTYDPQNEQAVIQRLLAAYQSAGQSTQSEQQRLLNQIAAAGY